jgi:hypothetical protein
MARFIINIRNRASALKTALGRDSGQVLMVGALVLPVLLGMTAMAVDVGTYASQRRTLQNAADSIALAAAKELPDEAAATTVANDWAEKNNIDPSEMTLQITQAGNGNPNPKVRVILNRPHSFVFARILGFDDKDVGAIAAAVKTSPGGLGGLVPWGVLEATKDASQVGDLTTLKYDSNNVSNGNFGAVRLDGSGSSVYGETIEMGSDSIICAKDVDGCLETSPQCDDYLCSTETGNMVGKTRSAVDWRMENTAEECDEIDEVFRSPIDGRTSLRNECNPWLEGGYESHRVILIPVIDQLCNGTCDVTVTGFAMFWLEGYPSGRCTGSECEIQGRFIDADVTVNALTGVYDPTASVQFSRLSE